MVYNSLYYNLAIVTEPSIPFK